MNIDQRNACLAAIEILKKVDIAATLESTYPEMDLKKIEINGLTGKQILTELPRTIRQIGSELKFNYAILPLVFNAEGNINLQSDLTSLPNYITTKQWTSVAVILTRLIQYQKLYGFYDRSPIKLHDVNAIELKKREEQIKFLEARVNRLNQEANEIKNQLTSDKKSFSNYITVKQKELEEIKTNVQASREATQGVQNLLTQATELNEKINSIKVQQDEKLGESKKNQEEQKVSFNTLLKDLNLILESGTSTHSELEKQKTTFTAHLEFVDSKKQHFEDRNKYLDDLIGREGSAALFETFKHRKEQLDKPVRFWQWSVAVVSVVTAAWVLAVFTNLFREFDLSIEWQKLIINSLKTLPGFILLGFTIKQYSKERAFQEEYAFKSAVALTVRSYVDVIKNEEFKDNLTLAAVLGIYHPPTSGMAKEEKADYLKAVVESARELIKRK